jgi:uncharacterized cofD-like protein
VADGGEVLGQAEISKARKIQAISLWPESLTANPVAVAAISEAEQLILGPGSLFTSLIAVLLVPGIAEAWRTSPARKVFVLNLIDQDGETLGMSGADHLQALAAIAGVGGPGLVIADSGNFPVPTGHSPVVVNADDALAWGWDVEFVEVVNSGADWPEHDETKLSQTLRRDM